jgi:gliding motility-associated-like protein
MTSTGIGMKALYSYMTSFCRYCRESRLTALATVFGYGFALAQPSAGIGEESKPFIARGDIFGTHVFIENRGQFDHKPSGSPVLYAMENGAEKVYFTATGLLFEVPDLRPLSKAERRAIERGQLDNPRPPVYVKLAWAGGNSESRVTATEKQGHYLTYGTSDLNSATFKKLTYLEVYPGIDLVFEIPAGKEQGFKYSFVVHPGANPAKIKLVYQGDSVSVSPGAEGSLFINTGLTPIAESQPFTYYKDNGQPLASAFSLNDDTVSFSLQSDYDPGRTIVIDPWVSLAVTLTQNQLAYDIDYDNAGRTFIYGGYNPAKVACYSANGQHFWTFSGSILSVNWNSQPSAWIGNFGVNKLTGRIFVGQGVNPSGSQIVRLNQSGNYDNYISNQTPNYQEVWDMGFHCTTGEVFSLGGGHNSNTSAATINSLNSSLQLATFQPSNTGAFQDIASHAVDEWGNIFVAYSTDNNTVLNNRLSRVNTGFNGNSWTQPNGISTLSEAANKLSYASNPPWLLSNGFNCLAVNSSHLFFYDGKTLAAYSKLTGSMQGSVALSTQTAKQQGGVVANDCNVVYLGGNGSILSYSFNGFSFSALPSLTFASSSSIPCRVFDLQLNKHTKTLYACGSGIVATYTLNSSCTAATGACVNNQGGGVLLQGYTGCTSILSATVSGFGGSGSYSYSWIPSGQTGSVATNLAPGSQTVILYDNQSSTTYSTTFVLSFVQLITSTLSATGMLNCHGTSNGTAAITAGGGSGQYYYYWTNGSSILITPTIGGLSAGNYTVIVFDLVTSCETSHHFTITQPPPLTATASAQTPTACTGSPVTLSASCSGGTPAYSYTWSTGYTLSTFTSTSGAGGPVTYTLLAKDSKGCAATAECWVLYVPTPTLVVAHDSICPLSTGTLLATGAQSYMWNSFSPGSTFTDSPTSTTMYTVAGTASGCTSYSTGVITILSAPLASITSNSPLCSGTTLYLHGTGGYCTWNGPGGFSATGSSVSILNICPSAPDIYSLTVTGANSCTASATHSVQVNPTPTISVPGKSICPLQLGILLASGAQTYTWNNMSTLSTLIDLPSSTQSYTVSGSIGPCTSSQTTQIVVLPAPMASLTSNSPICSGETLSLTAYGGLTYQWSGPAGFTSGLQYPVISNTHPSHSGIYQVTVIAANSCTAAAAGSATIKPTPAVTASGGTVCLHEAITLNAAGASSYAWIDKNGAVSTVKSPVIYAHNASATHYTVTGTSAGCSAQATTAVYTYPLPDIKAEVVSSSTACLFGRFTIKGSGAMFYYWKGPEGLSFNGQQITFTPTSLSQSGTYTLTASDVNNCTGSAHLQLSVLNVPYVRRPHSLEGCVPFCPNITFESLGSQPGVKALSWEVNGRTFTTRSASLCFREPGIHPLSVKLSGDNGCDNEQAFTVKAYPKPPTGFSIVPPLAFEGEEIVFTANPDVNAVSWEWAFYPAADGFTPFTWQEYQASYHYDIPGIYPVALVIKNKWGCIDSIVRPVTVGELYSVYVPNAFTPNLDGVNEVFAPVIMGVKGGYLAVHNRWGQKLFESNDLYKGWDGTFKGAPCKDDVYTWTLRIDHRDGRKEERTGRVTLYK